MIFDGVYWRENKGLFVKIDNKDYFVFGGFNDDNDFILEINKGHGNFITFDKNNNTDEYIYLLEKLANYPINIFIYNCIVDTLNKLNIKNNMKFKEV